MGPRIESGETGRASETRTNDNRGSARSTNYRNSNLEHFQWQLTGDKSHLATLYAAQIEECDRLEYINTEGSLWIDRVGVPYADLQRARLGGVALVRNHEFPGHVVSWKFAAPANEESVAILVPNATPTGFLVIAFNLETKPLHATMTGWNIDPGYGKSPRASTPMATMLPTSRSLPGRTPLSARAALNSHLPAGDHNTCAQAQEARRALLGAPRPRSGSGRRSGAGTGSAGTDS